MGSRRYLSMDKELNKEIDLIVAQAKSKGIKCSKVEVVRKLILNYKKFELKPKKVKKKEWSFFKC